MTIKEIYEWAKQHQLENAVLFTGNEYETYPVESLYAFMDDIYGESLGLE